MKELFVRTFFAVSNLWGVLLQAHEKDTKEIINIFEGFGYSPVCVARALANCELASKANNAQKFKPFQDSKLLLDRAKNCDDLLSQGDSASGIRTIYPYDCCRDKKVFVYCDQITDGGGWTVFQNRDALPIREDFHRTWIEYVLGFGNVTGEFWLGLNNIHALVSSDLVELRVDLEDYEGNKRWAKYGIFHIGDSSSKYILSIGKYHGDAGDGMAPSEKPADVANGMEFTTRDQDNDAYPANCAETFQGAWWYNRCHAANLNGYQYVGASSAHASGINWFPFRGYGYSLKKANMKIRKLFR